MVDSITTYQYNDRVQRHSPDLVILFHCQPRTRCLLVRERVDQAVSGGSQTRKRVRRGGTQQQRSIEGEADKAAFFKQQ